MAGLTKSDDLYNLLNNLLRIDVKKFLVSFRLAHKLTDGDMNLYKIY